MKWVYFKESHMAFIDVQKKGGVDTASRRNQRS
jgi:hypothetical protein